MTSSAYSKYKAWWIEYHGPTGGNTEVGREVNENAFKRHINGMTPFELMETLEMWEGSDDGLR